MLSILIGVLIQTPGPGFMVQPSIHGDKVVYTSEGDLWIADLTTKKATRLTSDVSTEDNAEFSPDGKWIAYSAWYDGFRQAYVMPANGGTPKRLSNIQRYNSVLGWTPDGKKVIYRGILSPAPYQFFTVPAEQGAAEKLPIEFGSHIWFDRNSTDYAITRFNRAQMAWFRYIGGLQNQIWVNSNGSFKQITNIDGTNEFPVYVGNEIYFVNEKEGTFRLMSIPKAGGAAKTHLTSEVEIRDLSSDGKRLVFEQGIGINLFNPSTKTIEPLQFEMDSDYPHMRPRKVNAQTYVTSASISAKGKRVYLESRGQLISTPVGEGETRVIKATPGVRYRYPTPSPDGKWLAYVSDESGDHELYLSDADGKNAKAITSGGKRQIVAPRWSPDSKWISYTDSNMHLRVVNVDTLENKVVDHQPFTWFGAPNRFSPDSKWIVFNHVEFVTNFGKTTLYELSTGKKIEVTDGYSDDVLASFSSDGKYLAFASRRNFAANWDPVINQQNMAPVYTLCLLPLKNDLPDPFGLRDPADVEVKAPDVSPDFRIDAYGLYGRRIDLPIPAGTFSQIEMVGNRLIYADGSGAIRFFDLASKGSGVITAGNGFELSADKTKLLLDGLRVVDVAGADVPPTAGMVSTNNLRIQIDPASEWKQMFWESWRYLRDYFYVANMHGHDWNAIGKKYEKYLSSVRSRWEVDILIRWMQAELGTSHMYLAPGDNNNARTLVQPAFLGIDVKAHESGYYQIEKIMRGDGTLNSERSPLANPALKVTEGMYLIEIAGTPAKVGHDIFGGLEGRAGRVVSVKVNDKPSVEGARTVLVKPVATENRMRYLTWVNDNRKYVEKASGGTIGYLHVAAMTDQDTADFVRQFYAQRNKKAFLIDSRYNNGGNTQNVMNNILSASLTGFFNMRSSPAPWTRQGDYFDGPMACLMNEFNISCGEEFPHRFKDLKLGKLFGRRTMGGEVGSAPGWPLIDGGVVNIANYGMYVPGEGWVIEGAGVSPDVDVPSDPNAFMKGTDPQLDATIKHLLDEIKKWKYMDIMPPKDRVRVKPPTG